MSRMLSWRIRHLKAKWAQEKNGKGEEDKRVSRPVLLFLSHASAIWVKRYLSSPFP